MMSLEDDVRAVLRAKAQSMRVPERPALDRQIVGVRRPRGQRWLLAVACLALVVAGVVAIALRPAGEPEPAPPAASVVPGTIAPTTLPTEKPEVSELLNNFLEARIAGEGADLYLNTPSVSIPLLYATTSQAPYERAEFERVPDVGWPNDFKAFTVRLFAGETVVEQLFFTPATGRLGLEYNEDGFGTNIAPTTEGGQPVVVQHALFGGEVTLQVAHPWIFTGSAFGSLIPEGPGVAPTTDGGERNHWDEFVLIPDAVGVTAGCPTEPSPTDAAALAESIRSNPDFGATSAVAVRMGGAEALTMDVAIPAGATICAPEKGLDLLNFVLDVNGPLSFRNGFQTGRATGEMMRLYLFDAPEGSSMQTLAVAIVAPAERLERAAQAAAAVIDSIEFRTT